MVEGSDTNNPAPIVPVRTDAHDETHPAADQPLVVDQKAVVTALSVSSDLADRFNTELLKTLKLASAPALPDVFFVGNGTDRSGTTAGTQPPDTHKDVPVPATRAGNDSPVDVTPGVKVDEKGRVQAIDYPNGTRREFGYDEKTGALNRIVQPDGQVYKLNAEGKWEIEQKGGAANQLPQDAKAGMIGMAAGFAAAGAGAGGTLDFVGPPMPGQPYPNYDQYRAPGALDFKNPKISPNGVLSWESLDGKAETTVLLGGSTVLRKDGGIVLSDDRGKVSLIQYPNGDQIAFSHDSDGQIDYFSRGGNVFKVRDNEIYGTDGLSTGQKFPFANPDGSFSVTDAQGNLRVTKLDGTSSISTADGGIIERDAKDHITQVLSADGKVRKFGYDDQGRLSSITDQDGKEYKFDAFIDLFGARFGSFEAADGTKLQDPRLKPDGTFVYETKDGKIHTDFASGRSTETTLTVDQLRMTAAQLDAFNWVFTSNSGIKERLDKMTVADRVALDETYKNVYGISLTDKLQGQLWNPLKRDASQAALDDLAEAHLRTKFAHDFSGTQRLTEANQALTDFRERAKKQGLTPEQMIAAQHEAVKQMDLGATEGQRQQGLERALTNAAPTSDSLNARYSVKYDEETRADGTTVRHYYVDGEKGEKAKILDTTSDDPQEIERQLKEWQTNKMKELEGKFNVQFSHDGERESASGKTVDLRAPNIAELVALEGGLQQSQPSTRTSNGRPIMVQFALQPVTTADAWVMPRPDGQDRILFEPVDRMGAWGLKRTILHEWGHNAQNLMEKADPAALEKHYQEIGYRKVDGHWYLEGKDGNLYIQGPGRVPSGSWTRVNEKGEPLRPDGTPARGFDDPKAASYTNTEMREQAKVKPMTLYFPQPNERSADAVWHFRGDKDSRSSLYLNDITLYNSTKSFDQKTIDTDPRYGTNPDGSSKFIRMPDGAIEPNTEANRKTVDDFEKQIATQRAMIEKLKQAEVDGSRDRAMLELKRELENQLRNRVPEAAGTTKSGTGTESRSGTKPRKSK